MVETITRLYHCHKIHKHVTVYEEYEVSGNSRRLLRCSCPYHQYTEMKPKVTFATVSTGFLAVLTDGFIKL